MCCSYLRGYGGIPTQWPQPKEESPSTPVVLKLWGESYEIFLLWKEEFLNLLWYVDNLEGNTEPHHGGLNVLEYFVSGQKHC